MSQTTSRKSTSMESGRPPPIHLSVRLELPEKEPRTFEYDFEQSVITLGRDPSNDIQVPLTTVSRQHARIFYERGDYFLEDLGSTHGTQHNGRVITGGEKRLLRGGDRISIVSFHIVFETSSGTMMDRQPGERTEQLARRMVQEVLQSLGSADAERPSLRIMNGEDEGRRFELSDDAAEVVIGRSPDCEITLDDHNTSRRHCLVKRSWHGFTAQDLGSRNGVLVNGLEIEGARMLRDGDELQIGGVKLAFIDPPSRLLEQMGGLGDEMDPVGTNETAHGNMPAADLLEEEPEPEPEYEGAEDDLAPPEEEEAYDYGGGSPYEPAADLGSRPPIDLPEEDRKILDRLTSGGAAFDIAILVFGGLFLLGALAFIAFVYFV